MTDTEVMTDTELRMFKELVEIANKDHDGHLTIMKFTTNWRVSFGTPEMVLADDPDDAGPIAHMPSGSTFLEAAAEAMLLMREAERRAKRASATAADKNEGAQ